MKTDCSAWALVHQSLRMWWLSRLYLRYHDRFWDNSSVLPVPRWDCHCSERRRSFCPECVFVHDVRPHHHSNLHTKNKLKTKINRVSFMCQSRPDTYSSFEILNLEHWFCGVENSNQLWIKFHIQTTLTSNATAFMVLVNKLCWWEWRINNNEQKWLTGLQREQHNKDLNIIIFE